MRVLITGGGTAGHINPALAIASTIKKNIPNAEIEFVGTQRGLESTLVPQEGYKLHYVKVSGISRSLSPSNIKSIFLLIGATLKARKIIKAFKPDIVIGTGGYVCVPALMAASLMGIPTAAHESNAQLGLALKLLRGRVDRFFINFKDTERFFNDKSKVMHVGNPLRKGFGGYDKKEAREALGIPDDKTYILAFGGSLGAQMINETVFRYMKNTAQNREDVYCELATGKNYYEEFSNMFTEAQLDSCPHLSMRPYINDMPLRMSAADVIICRAGAMTISEIAMMKKAAFIIPSPNVVDNHQYKNAKVLADANAAVMLEEKDINEEGFARIMNELVTDKAKRNALSDNIEAFANLDANKLIYEEILKLIKK